MSDPERVWIRSVQFGLEFDRRRLDLPRRPGRFGHVDAFRHFKPGDEIVAFRGRQEQHLDPAAADQRKA